MPGARGAVGRCRRLDPLGELSRARTRARGLGVDSSGPQTLTALSGAAEVNAAQPASFRGPWAGRLCERCRQGFVVRTVTEAVKHRAKSFGTRHLASMLGPKPCILIFVVQEKHHNFWRAFVFVKCEV